jgi:hypothetical protein
MKNIARLALALVLVTAAESGTATAQSFVGGVTVSCNDFRGLPVTLLTNPAWHDAGTATLGPGGQPIIILNSSTMEALHPVFQLFLYAHECAHHALGHIINRNLLNEAEADCWAVKTGRQQGWFPPQAFQGLIVLLGNSQGSPWGHLPGPGRIQNMINCYGA